MPGSPPNTATPLTGYTWNYDEQIGQPGDHLRVALEYGATDPLTVQDEFWDSYQDYQQYASYLPALAVLALVLDIAGILLLVFLLRAAGWRKEESRPRCNWFDRIPLDLLAFGAFWGHAPSFSTRGRDRLRPQRIPTGHRPAGRHVCHHRSHSGLCPGLLPYRGHRIKTRTLWSNTLICMLCKLIARGCRRRPGAGP